MPALSFQVASLACAALFLILTLGLLFAPEKIMYSKLGIKANASADVMSKRASMLFLSFAALMALTSWHQPSETRNAVALSVFIVFVSLAVLGFIEHLRGNVEKGVWSLIIGEIVFAYLIITAV